MAVAPPRKGRGAVSNLQGRFERWTREAWDDGWGEPQGEESAPLKTTVEREAAKSILSRNDSPDIPFTQSINPYRGCEHGCVYCYARPTHSYLGLSPGLDFETKLFAKVNGAELLRKELSAPGYRCQVIALGAATDPYQPVERKLKVTRSILEVLAECEHPFTLVTKSALVERDLDLLAPMARKNLVRTFISITTLDHGLARRLEPRASAPARRVEAIRALMTAGVPVGVLVAPVIPFLTDSQMEAVLAAAREAGADSAGYVLLRLPHEVKDLFQEWLAVHYPLKSEHVMSLIRQLREGKENDPRFGTRMRGTGLFAQLLARRFQVACERLGLNRRAIPLDTGRFRPPARNGQAGPPPAGGQLALF